MRRALDVAAAFGGSRSMMDAPRLLGCSFIALDPHAGSGGEQGGNLAPRLSVRDQLPRMFEGESAI
jgi:hypothetical protein